MIKYKLPCGRVFTIDDCDLPLLDGVRVYSDARGNTRYVRVRVPGQRAGGKYLHNLIMNGRTDHIDGNGLNNLRSNLRRGTQALNGLNRSAKSGKRFKGVYQHRSGRFYAQIAIFRKVYSSPPFDAEEDAAVAYDAMARRLHGDWARLNLPDRDEPGFRWMDKIDTRQPDLPLIAQ